jgi:hypothetical protein
MGEGKWMLCLDVFSQPVFPELNFKMLSSGSDKTNSSMETLHLLLPI